MITGTFKEFLIWWGVYVTLMFATSYVWELIDTWEFGAPQPSCADTLFGIILCWMLANKIGKKLIKNIDIKYFSIFFNSI